MTETSHQPDPQDQQQSLIPTITLPKGGGAIRGVGEKFTANPAGGTATAAIPIASSAGRSGFAPMLALGYDSAAGNGPFGFGWSLGLPAVTRKTDKGLPRYQDHDESDVFIMSGAEDLVPVLETNGKRQAREANAHWTVYRYRPRVEGSYVRIERWTDRKTGETHWRSIASDNVTTLYGRTPESRIADAGRVFSWLICETYDGKGNAVTYEYVAEDDANVDTRLLSERNRARGSQRYLKRVKYGNVVSRLIEPDLSKTDWLFELVFDYDEGHLESPGDHSRIRAFNESQRPWACRPDPFSTHRPGFEIRTYRRCHRILMFHRFPELGPAPCLVRSTEFDYADLAQASSVGQELAHQGSTRFASFLRTVTHAGYVADGEAYLRKAMPSVEFTYSKARIDETVRVLGPDSVVNLPAGVDGRDYRWVDLDGEGMAGILADQGGGWYFKANLGNGTFGPLRSIPTRPSQVGPSGQSRLVDLGGDGRLDLVDLGGPMPGFYRRSAEGGWDPFRPFATLPAIAWDDPNLRMVDLNGGGRADALITDQQGITWHASLAEDGFGEGRRVVQPSDEECGPRLVFADGTHSVYLADMCGDGLADLVRVRNGEICYWPNQGYGRFGAKVTLDNTAEFDLPDLFDQRRVRLADIDGSGTADVIYLARDGVRLYFNQSGNRLSDPHDLRDVSLPDSADTVETIDLLGNGTTCLVWSSPLPADAAQPMRYLDLLADGKPHLLVKMANGMGGETHIDYVSSTKFYIADRLAGRPWATRLPFPVQVVERVELLDEVSRSRFVTRYAYHDGYFDPEEREFRGFGLVEEWDTEEYAALAKSGRLADAFNIDAASHVPPVLTRTWFHTGGPADRPDPPPPPELPPAEQREAIRALKGRVRRQATYGLDGSAQAEVPYQVTEQHYNLKRLQPRGPNHHAVVRADPREAVTYTYERRLQDPRIDRALTLETDDFGNPLLTATVAHGRRNPDPALPAADQATQAATVATCTENRFTNAIDAADDYRTPMPYEKCTYELTGLNAFSFDDVAAASRDDAHKRLMDHTRIRYRRNDLTGALPWAELGSLGLQYEKYTLVFTPELIKQVYGDRVTDAMLTETGHIQLDGNDGWWAPSGQIFYAQTAVDELAHARQTFFLPHRVRDPFGNETTVSYDQWSLLLVESRDALGNRTSVQENDYRVLKPRLIMDPNSNRGAVAFDALGMVVGTAVMGKQVPAPPEGDSLDDFQADLPAEIIRAHLDDPLANPRQIIGSAGSRLIYDMSANPPVVYTVARTMHETDGAPTAFMHDFSYSDGLGREIQRKILAKSTERPRWLGTGWTIYNNKGKPIRRFEPFYTTRHDFEFDMRAGSGAILFYDPIGRPVATLNPDHTWEKTVYTAWQKTNWDTTDTILISDPAADPDVGGFFARLPPGDIHPTWHSLRVNGALGPLEKAAADKSGVLAGTPAVTYADPLSREFITVLHNRSRNADSSVHEEFHRRHVLLDVEGSVRSVSDPLGRIVVRYGYDHMRGRVHQASMEGGPRWLLKDVLGNPCWVWDGRGHVIRTTYDQLRRPADSYLLEDSGPEVLAERRIYGESQDVSGTRNLRGHIIQLFDQAGLLVTDDYDFKGNPRSCRRRFARDYRTTLDWSAEVALSEETYISHTRYDALNRPVQATAPHSEDSRDRATVLQAQYDEGKMLNRVDVWLDQPGEPTGLLSPDKADLHAVTAVEYDANGRRTRITYGNGVETTYSYDDMSKRLTQLRTGDLQDLRYTYDASGNISYLVDKSQPSVFFRNQRVDPDSDYTYDALYRLIEATGREHLGQAGGMPTPDSHDDTRWGADDGTAMSRYVERYVYDPVGNLLSMGHRRTDPANPGWTRTYSYNEASQIDPGQKSNRLTSMAIGDTTESYSRGGDGYDAHGNMMHMPHVPELHWDFRDQLQLSRRAPNGGGTWYVYDSAGRRTRKVTELANGEIQEERLYMGAFEIYRRSGSSPVVRETLHIMDDKRRIALVETRVAGDDGTPARLVRYQLGNHLGSSVLEVGGEGQILSYEEYTPYGSASYQAVRAGKDPPKRYRYLGLERDEETGFAYHGARYYAHWLGRWTASDPGGLRDGVNTYSYVDDNPVNQLDLTGNFKLSWKHVAIGAGGALIAVGLTIATAGLAAPLAVAVLGEAGAATLGTGIAIAGTGYGAYSTVKSAAEINHEIKTGHNSAGEKVSEEQISAEIGSTTVGAIATLVGAKGIKFGGPPGGNSAAEVLDLAQEIIPVGNGVAAVGPPRIPVPPVSAIPLPVSATPAAVVAGASTVPVSMTTQAMANSSWDNGGGDEEDPVPLIDQEFPGASGNRSVDPQGAPLPDPTGKSSEFVHPSQPVVDHALSRAIARFLGMNANSPKNLNVKTWEANARKAGFEGNYLKSIVRYIKQGMTPKDAVAALKGELKATITDVHPVPVDPIALDALPNQTPNPDVNPDLVCR